VTIAASCVDALRQRAETLATAESLTAGLVCSTLAEVPGASDVLRGGLAAYATDVKVAVLGVDPAVVAEHGVVSAACVQEMARRACSLFASDWALATTGVAGPTEQEGRPVGTVFVAVCGPGRLETRELTLAGTRDDVRRGAVGHVLSLLSSTLATTPT
jgi:nicotinamide-nucleotide amidase